MSKRPIFYKLHSSVGYGTDDQPLMKGQSNLQVSPD